MTTTDDDIKQHVLRQLFKLKERPVASEVRFEWDIETVFKNEILDHNHRDKLAEFDREELIAAINGNIINEQGHTSQLVLVRDRGNNVEGLIDRTWAYVKKGTLPYRFSDAGDRPGVLVPLKFLKELRNVFKSTPLQAGDLVQVRYAGSSGVSPVVWEIVSTDALRAGSCMIREAGTEYAAQRFDTSLLVRVHINTRNKEQIT